MCDYLAGLRHNNLWIPTRSATQHLPGITITYKQQLLQLLPLLSIPDPLLQQQHCFWTIDILYLHQLCQLFWIASQTTSPKSSQGLLKDKGRWGGGRTILFEVSQSAVYISKTTTYLKASKGVKFFFFLYSIFLSFFCVILSFGLPLVLWIFLEVHSPCRKLVMQNTYQVFFRGLQQSIGLT